MVGLRQEFKQSQQLVMTQQLQQSIKLLQLSAHELQAYLEEELEKNPLLRRDEGDDGADNEKPETQDTHDEALSKDSKEDERASAKDTYEQAQGDSSYTDGEQSDHSDDGAHASSDHYSASEHKGFQHDTSLEGRSFEESLVSEKSLRDILSEQIGVEIEGVVERMLATGMIDFLDEAGYLREQLPAVAKQLGADEEMVEHVLVQLQTLEPSGIFARDLTECLRLQLADKNRLDPAMETMLAHLHLMGEGKLSELKALCGIEQEEDFAEMLADIRMCNPKPASPYTVQNAQIVIPDVLVKRGNDGGWLIELNPDALPKVLVRNEYAAKVGGKADKEAKKYVNEQLAHANWLVKALDQRANTILKVAEEIIKKQESFLMHGIRFLKPLVLRDIADAIDMHESTVSRVTNGKFMATPRGTLEMKYFFTSSIGAQTGGSEFSSKTVMYYIKEAIDAEDAKKILSDDAIVALLKRRNINVARRTVTKYREGMNIPSSIVRRRQKRASNH